MRGIPNKTVSGSSRRSVRVRLRARMPGLSGVIGPEPGEGSSTLPPAVVAGGATRRGTDVIGSVGFMLGAAVCYVALVIIEASFPSGEPPSSVGGGSFSSETPLAPVLRTTTRGAGAHFWRMNDEAESVR